MRAAQRRLQDSRRLVLRLLRRSKQTTAPEMLDSKPRAKKKEAAMSNAFAKLKEFLDSNDLRYREEPEHGIVQLHVTSKHGSWQCFAHVNADRNVFSFYSLLPTRVKQGKRAAVSETITRANYGLLIGGFEMDFEDGEVRYRSSMPLEDGDISEDSLQHVILCNVHTVDRYFDSIMAVMYSDLSPEEAIRRAEKQEDEPTFDFEAYR